MSTGEVLLNDIILFNKIFITFTFYLYYHPKVIFFTLY